MKHSITIVLICFDLRVKIYSNKCQLFSHNLLSYATVLQNSWTSLSPCDGMQSHEIAKMKNSS